MILPEPDALICALKKEIYYGGGVYPGDKWTNVGRGQGMLVVRKGGVASWAGERNEGIFLEGGKISRGEVIGIYGGRVVEEEGLYVLEMRQNGGRKIRVDGTYDGSKRTIFGMLNEDIHGGRWNVLIGEMGVMIAREDIAEGDELLTCYGKGYDWDDIKEGAKNGAIGQILADGRFCELEIRWMRVHVREMRKNRGDKRARILLGALDGRGGPMHGVALGSMLGGGAKAILEWICGGELFYKYSHGKWGMERELVYETIWGRCGMSRWVAKWNGEGLYNGTDKVNVGLNHTDIRVEVEEAIYWTVGRSVSRPGESKGTSRKEGEGLDTESKVEQDKVKKSDGPNKGSDGMGDREKEEGTGSPDGGEGSSSGDRAEYCGSEKTYGVAWKRGSRWNFSSMGGT